jgi:hypothetical protein
MQTIPGTNIPQSTRYPRATPWGQAESIRELAPGVALYATAGHGGIYVAPERLEEIPAEMRAATFTRSPQWYEEDCDWCIPVVALGLDEAHGLTPGVQEMAANCLRRNHPELARFILPSPDDVTAALDAIL